MIKTLYTCMGTGFNPYENLALEEMLLTHVPEESCILYLWQNQKTVVIGKNQNAWKECRVKELEEDGGFLARRLSGGGAVFHDLGNLNFTFLMNSPDYDLSRQLDVILQAVASLGISAQKSGRNDVTTTDGRKFSGNAFYHHGGKSYHHGTLMLQVDKDLVARYLNVSAAKLSSKGVSSVKSRVVNLVELQPELTVEAMKEALVSAFEQVYGLPSQPFPVEDLNGDKTAALAARNASFDWRLGRNIPFDWQGECRFPWGGIELKLRVESGRVQEAALYSDAMDGDFIPRIAPLFTGKIFSSQELGEALSPLLLEDIGQLPRQMVEDLRDFIRSQEF